MIDNTIPENRISNKVYDVNSTGGGGGGGGGPATIADGADVALGARNQTPATDDAGTWSLVQLFKRWLQRWSAALDGTTPLFVSGQIFSGTVDITVDTSAYADGDNIGGLITVSNMFAGVNRGSLVPHVALVSPLSSATYWLHCYRRLPLPNVTFTNNAPMPNFGAAGIENRWIWSALLPKIRTSGDRTLYGAALPALAMRNSEDANGYFALEAGAALTYSSTDGGSLQFGYTYQ